MLSGEVIDAATLDKAVTIARQFGPEIINSVSVMSPRRVMLEVRFIEISRTAGRELRIRVEPGRQQKHPECGQPRQREQLAHQSNLDRNRCRRRRDLRRLAVRLPDRARLVGR